MLMKFVLLSWKSSRVNWTMMPSGSRTVASLIAMSIFSPGVGCLRSRLTKTVIFQVQSPLGLLWVPGQVCLGSTNGQSHGDSVWFPFGCAVCGKSLLGPFSFGSQNCLPSGGTLQSVISHGCGSVASGHRPSDLDGRSVPSSGLWSERCTAQVVEPSG